MTRKKKAQNCQPSKTAVSSPKDGTKESGTLPKEFFEHLPEEAKIAYLEAQSFQGPLPPPSLFGQYEQILPGSADRILILAEKEQSHRHKWESDVLVAQKSDVGRGQWMGFGLGMAGLIVAFFCSYFGFPVVAAASIGTVLAGIVTAFLKGRPNAEKDD